MFTFCPFSEVSGTKPIWTKPALLGGAAPAQQHRFVDIFHGVWGSRLLERMGVVGTGEAQPLHWFFPSLAIGL